MWTVAVFNCRHLKRTPCIWAKMSEDGLQFSEHQSVRLLQHLHIQKASTSMWTATTILSKTCYGSIVYTTHTCLPSTAMAKQTALFAGWDPNNTTTIICTTVQLQCYVQHQCQVRASCFSWFLRRIQSDTSYQPKKNTCPASVICITDIAYYHACIKNDFAFSVPLPLLVSLYSNQKCTGDSVTSTLCCKSLSFECSGETA